jgi:hypothetical protein
MACHLFTFEYAARRLTLSDRAWRPVGQ